LKSQEIYCLNSPSKTLTTYDIKLHIVEGNPSRIENIPAWNEITPSENNFLLTRTMDEILEHLRDKMP